MFEAALSRLLKSSGAVLAAVAALCVGGALAYRGLKVDLFPPLDFPVLSVVTEAPGLSSLEMERQVTLPIESAVGGVLGVAKVRAVMAAGISMVSAEFAWGTDMVTARQLLLAALAQARGQLPGDAEPSVESLSATLAQIEGYSLQGPPGFDLARLRDIADYELKPRLQSVSGVYKVAVVGGRVREYSVYPDPPLLVKYGVSLDDLRAALSDNNIVTSPGTVDASAQELVLTANGQFASAAEIGSVVVAVKRGTPVRVRDLARVREAYQFQREDTAENGSPSVLVNIYKQPRFDTLEVAADAARVIADFSRGLPPGVTVHNYYDQARLVADSVGSVKEAVVIGAALVVVVLLGFLRSLRMTAVAALSIPVSVAGALVLMRWTGVGLNIMSLGGLAVGTGIIVDDAIVVLENIFRHFSTPELSQGRTAPQVVAAAASEVMRPVVVSTLTNVGIFLPMAFVEGLSGKLFTPVALTVAFALSASLLTALTVIPVLVLKTSASAPPHEGDGGAPARMYARALDAALRRPVLVLALLGLVPALAAWAAFTRLDVAFLPALDESALQLQTTLPPGASLSESRRVNSLIETWVRKIPGVETVVRHTGHAAGTLDIDSVNRSDIDVKLVPKSRRPIALDDLVDMLAEKTSRLPEVNVEYLMPLADKINDAMGGIPYDLGVDIYGPDFKTLDAQAAALVDKLRKVPGAAEVRPPEDIPIPALETVIDKEEAGRLGISERAIFDALSAYSPLGLQATSVRRLFRSEGVVLHLSPQDRGLDIAALKSIPLTTAGGNTVPLEQVASLRYAQVPNKIFHERLSRKVTVAVDVRGRNVSDVAADARRLMAQANLPPGYSWSFSGKYGSEQGAMGNMGMVMFLAVAVVAAILWLEFRSLAQVGLVLLTLPLAAVGAAISLWAFGQTLNVSSMIGAVMLVGIAVRNGIILLDYMNAEAAAGKSPREAARSAALKRARPILMTASVTILGLVPIATGLGTGSELLQPLAVAVMGGLLASTLLTLLVLPCAALLASPSK